MRLHQGLTTEFIVNAPLAVAVDFLQDPHKLMGKGVNPNLVEIKQLPSGRYYTSEKVPNFFNVTTGFEVEWERIPSGVHTVAYPSLGLHVQGTWTAEDVSPGDDGSPKTRLREKTKLTAPWYDFAIWPSILKEYEQARKERPDRITKLIEEEAAHGQPPR